MGSSSNMEIWSRRRIINFLENKYKRWYFSIIENVQRENRQHSSDYERHHIIPRSIAKDSELVSLSFREHFLCHWLLTKFTVGCDKRSMCFALHCMRRSRKDHRRKLTSWQIELARKANREALKGNTNGKSLKGIPKSEEHRKKLAVALKGNQNTKGIKISSDRIKKMYDGRIAKGVKPSATHLNIVKKSCPHCGLITNCGNLALWHNDRCKERKV